MRIQRELIPIIHGNGNKYVVAKTGDGYTPPAMYTLPPELEEAFGNIENNMFWCAHARVRDPFLEMLPLPIHGNGEQTQETGV